MTSFWAMHRRKGIYALGGLLIVAGLGTLNVAAQTTARDFDDPVNLFAEMMPVFRSPRCVNCHGGTDPNVQPEGLNHEAGQVDVPMDGLGNMNAEGNAACVECHTAPAAKTWHLAPLPMSFVGKDSPLVMCRQMRSFNSLDIPAQRQAFIDHLQSDPLIGLAFEGQGGIGPDSSFAPITPEPPPMSKQAFLAAAQRWVVDGEAACSNQWNGTITETSKMAQSVKFAPAPGGREVGSETTITITVVKNEATAEVYAASHDFTDVPTKECATYVHLTLSAVAHKVPVELTVALNTPKIPVTITQPPGTETPPTFVFPPGFEFPPGFDVPPGMTLPPGFELPTGFTLPPGASLPSGTTGASVPAFFRYAPTDKSEVSGNNHLDIRSLPGCKQTVTDQKQPYQIEGALIEITVNPSSPNHLVGQKDVKIEGGTRVIKWDLTHVVE